MFKVGDKVVTNQKGITHLGKARQFLTDHLINISIAHRLFVDSGNSFNLWTCGKNLGI